MIRFLWYRILNVFKYIFIQDPFNEYIEQTVNSFKLVLHEQKIYYETTIGHLRLEIKQKDAEYRDLQDTVIGVLLKDNEPKINIVQKEDPLIIPRRSPWDTRRERLERAAARPINSRVNREVLTNIEEVENQVLEDFDAGLSQPTEGA